MTADGTASMFVMERDPELAQADGASEPVPVPGTVDPAGTSPGDGGTNLLVPRLVPAVPTAGTDLVPVPPRAGVRVRFIRLARAQIAEITAYQEKHSTFLHAVWVAVWETPPETLAAHREHLKSRAWLQDYLTGHIRWLIEHENIAYGILIARPAKATLQTLDKIFERQSRFLFAAGVVVVGLIIGFVSHHL